MAKLRSSLRNHSKEIQIMFSLFGRPNVLRVNVLLAQYIRMWYHCTFERPPPTTATHSSDNVPFVSRATPRISPNISPYLSPENLWQMTFFLWKVRNSKLFGPFGNF